MRVLPMHVMTSFDLRSLQDTAKVRAMKEATHGGRSALGACVVPAPNALLVSVQLCFVLSQDQQRRERFQTNSQQVCGHDSGTIAWPTPPTCTLHV